MHEGCIYAWPSRVDHGMVVGRYLVMHGGYMSGHPGDGSWVLSTPGILGHA